MVESLMCVRKIEEIACGIMRVRIFAEQLESIQCGQFLNVTIPKRPDLLLKRPFGICEVNKELRELTFCFQVVGEGTHALSLLKEGELLSVTYPLGNGFTLDGRHKKVVLVGGGVGVFPLVSVLKQYKNVKFYSFMGYKTAQVATYHETFAEASEQMYLATDDGSLGEKGFVTDLLKRNIGHIKPDIVLSCGPIGLFKALKKVMADNPGIPTKVSLEERMGCGIGACLVCTCKIQSSDGVHHKRVCKDGPVFELSEVEL